MLSPLTALTPLLCPVMFGLEGQLPGERQDRSLADCMSGECWPWFEPSEVANTDVEVHANPDSYRATTVAENPCSHRYRRGPSRGPPGDHTDASAVQSI